MNEKGARIFLIGFTLVTLLVLFQQLFHPIKLAGLQGAFDAGEPPRFSASLWFEGKYQQHSDHFLKYNTAFNGELVRLRNQVDYSVFGNINTILTLGKENYIFDPNYIYSINGTDLLNDSLKSQKIQAIYEVKTILDSLSVPLLICFAPNKANYFQEYLNDVLINSKRTNRILFDSIFKSFHVPVLDYDKWFLTLKDTSSWPLVPKFGAHWSTYGAFFAADTLLSSLRALTGKNLASFSVIGIDIALKTRYTDDDYLASLNLMIKWKSPPMAYPILQFHSGDKPNVMIVSDSFIWNFYDLQIIQNCFSDKSQIRYYNKSTFDINKNPTGVAGEIKLADLANRDCIIIISSDPSLKDLGFGFLESVSNLKQDD